MRQQIRLVISPVQVKEVCEILGTIPQANMPPNAASFLRYLRTKYAQLSEGMVMPAYMIKAGNSACGNIPVNSPQDIFSPPNIITPINIMNHISSVSIGSQAQWEGYSLEDKKEIISFAGAMGISLPGHCIIPAEAE